MTPLYCQHSRSEGWSPCISGPGLSEEVERTLSGRSRFGGYRFRVRYANGQLCTFKRKARSTKDNE